MLASLMLLLLLSDAQRDHLAAPWRRGARRCSDRADRNIPPIRLFDREYVATDDPAFVLLAIESTRQGIVDARSAQSILREARPGGRGRTDPQAERNALINVSKRWPKARAGACRPTIPQRASTLRTAGEARTAANFIVSQIATHEATIAQFRAQLGGKGDAQLKRALRETLPGYQRESLTALAAEALRMLSDNAAFAASPYATHAGAFQPGTARRPTAGWLAIRDAYSPCTEQTSPPFMRAFPTARSQRLARAPLVLHAAIASRLQRAADLAGRPAPARRVRAGADAVHARSGTRRRCGS